MNMNVSNNSELTADEALRQLDLMVLPQTESSISHTENRTEQVSKNVDEGEFISTLTEDIQNIVLTILKLNPSDFSPTTPLMEYGLDSIAATEIGNLFTSRFNIVIPPTVFFEFQDLQSFVHYIMDNHISELKAKYSDLPNNSAAKVTDISVKEIEPSQSQHQRGTSSSQSVVSEAQSAELAQPLSIEGLWQLSLSESEPSPLKTVESKKGNLENAVLTTTSQTELREPSREFLQSMKTYTDRAHIHTITRVGKQPLEYGTYGEGTPLLMLGGLLMHFNVMWLTNLKALGEHHQLIMFHMPGCGSLELHEDMNLNSLADDIAAVLDAHGITQPLPVFGCSFGGVLAQAFVLSYPERCSALAIAVSTPFAEGATDFNLLMKELQVSPNFMELNRGWPMASLPAYEKVIEGFDFREQLKSLNMPAFIVSGGKDRYTTPDFSRMMVDNLQHAEWVNFPDAGHLLTFSHYDEFNELLIKFLDSVQRKPKLGSELTTGSVYLPANKKTLEIVKNYVLNGQQGHSVMLSEYAAQLAFVLNLLCNQNKITESLYRSYFLTSIEEALDAAIRLSRHQRRNKDSKSTGKVLIIDSSERWSNYFDPMHQGENAALVPSIYCVTDLEQAERLIQQEKFVAISFAANLASSSSQLEQFIAICNEHDMISILIEMNEHHSTVNQWLSASLTQNPDLIVFGECISDFQAPVAAMLINESVSNPWLMTPSEGYVRQPMANFGLTVQLAFEFVVEQLSELLSGNHQNEIRHISTDPISTYQAHLKYGNVGYAKVANLHGYDARFFEGYGLRSRTKRQGEASREIIDCLSNVGNAPRGLNPQDVIDDVIAMHQSTHDYWQDLVQVLKAKTGFTNALSCSSQTTAIESAITLAKLASPQREKILCFSGGAGFSLLSANTAKDELFDLFRKPFQPLYPHTVFIDPDADNAGQSLEKELLSGTLALVWFETIQVEGNAVRPIPKHLIDLINKHRSAGGYLVCVDETQTNLFSGKFLHSEGQVMSPDIVAIATGLTDSLFPIGAVLTTDALLETAKQTNAKRLLELQYRNINQLSAHIALHSLQQIDANDLMRKAREMGVYLKQSLQELANSFPLIHDIRGEGLILAVEFDLTGYDAFIQQSFGYFLWGAMLRDQEKGVALVVCPIHNRSIRVMPPMTITHSEIDLIVDNLRRRMTEGVEKILHNCAEYCRQQGDERTAGYLSSLVRHEHE